LPTIANKIACFDPSGPGKFNFSLWYTNLMAELMQERFVRRRREPEATAGEIFVV